MTESALSEVPDAVVFRATPPITLADVMARIDVKRVGTARRDALSALRVLADRGGIDLAAIPAHAQVVRQLLSGLKPEDLGVSPTRWANIRSLVSGAVAELGMPRTCVTREIIPAPSWAVLLAEAPEQCRWSLGRLACYCTVKGLAPEDVRVETLLGLHAALEAESVIKAPRRILKQTISSWNKCRREVPGWPATTLASPFKSEPFMLPLDAFPEGFQQAVAAWEARMSNPDPLDPDSPLRALRPATLASYRLTFRRAASALVRGNILRIEQVTGFDVFFVGNNLKEALRPFLPQGSGRNTGYAQKIMIQLAAVARRQLRLDEATLEAVDVLVRRLDPRTGQSMGARNKTRLAQFDDPEIVQRLLRFPEEEYARAMARRNPLRRARGVERALAISLLIFTGIRVQNLRTLRSDCNIHRFAGRVLLRFSGPEMKSGADLELELPVETIQLLETFVASHRGLLPGADSPFLFPGTGGGPRSYSAMRDAVSDPLLKHAGIELSPHLYRHIVAKIVAEREPGMLTDLSRRLGHKSVNTTYQSYLGTETPAASRRINRLLQETRAVADGAVRP